MVMFFFSVSTWMFKNYKATMGTKLKELWNQSLYIVLFCSYVFIFLYFECLKNNKVLGLNFFWIGEFIFGVKAQLGGQFRLSHLQFLWIIDELKM